jgi:periplasmic protein TonB
MERELNRIPSFDDIVFENRNKEYGAYKLRKKYNRNVIIALMISTLILGTVVITPYLNAKAAENKSKRAERQVEIKMESLDRPTETVVPPPPPPPPPQDVVQQAKYVPPVVVDSVKPEDIAQLMSADQAQIEIKNEDVNIQEVTVAAEEVQENVDAAEPFYVVEEMPMFPGGDEAIQKYIGDNVVYPEVAKENNIQGRVIVKFCVTPKGGVDQVSILKGVDPELDAEVVRVVKTLPKFKPGKQGGKPVPVWYTIPINFQLK